VADHLLTTVEPAGARGVPSPRRRAQNRNGALRIGIVLVCVLAACAVFLVLDARNPWLVLPYRAPKLGALLVVGWATALSTVIFQTITGNRILTPAIMGFDALYSLLQTLLILFLGGIGYASLPSTVRFTLTTVIMVGFSLLLFGAVFRGKRSVTTVVLAGVIVGTLLRAITTFVQRIMDPSDYLILQSRLFASFNMIDSRLLVFTTAVVAVTTVCAWRWLRALDVMALGRDTAVSLGVDERGLTRRVLVVVSILISVSTALVGPITFFGLLVAHLAYKAAGTDRHVITVPMAIALAMLVLVAGQTILHKVLGDETVLSVVIDFLGGIVLIALLIRRPRRPS